MSQGTPFPPPYGDSNPYRTPASTPGMWPPQSYATAPPVPTFCTVMFVVSLLFCFLRLIFVALGFVGLSTIPADNPLAKTVWFELGTGIGMVLCGIPGNFLLLAKNPIGAYLGWGNIAFTVGSIFVGLAQFGVQFDQLTGGNPAAAGPAIVGAGIMVLIRVGILVAYGAAIVQFMQWHARYGSQVKAY